MSYNNNSIFLGKINDTNPTELIQKIDYSKNKLEDRMALINELLGSGFYEKYFDEYFKVNINSGDSLSDSDGVCVSLEKMANYLLNSEEVKAEKRDTEYIFYSDEEAFNKAISKELKIEGMGVEQDNIIHYLKKENRNYKSSKNQSITKKDYERDDWLGEVLRTYQLYLHEVTKELKSYEGSNLSRYKLSEISGAVKQDMANSKDILLGVFGYKTNAEESTVIDWDFCDLTNPNHVKALLYLKPGNRNDKDLQYLIEDFVEKLNMARPTKLQKEIVILMRYNKGPTEIGETLGVSKQRVNKNIQMLVDRIVKIAKALK